MSAKDTYSKIKTSVKARLDEELQMINRLGISTEQKNAMFKAAGDAMQKLGDERAREIMNTCCPELVINGDVNKAVAAVVEEGTASELVSVLEALAEQTTDEAEADALFEMASLISEAKDDDAEDEDEEDAKKADEEDKAAEEDEDKEEKLEEALNKVFGQTVLTEDVKEKISVLFEAAVVEKALKVSAEIEQRLNEEKTNELAFILEQLDVYLSEFADSFITENQLAVEQGIRVEIMENFFGDFRTLIESHNLNIDVDKQDLTEELDERVQSLESTLDKALHESADLKATIKSFERKEVLAKVGRELTESQKEKLATLAEELDFTSAASFTKKIEVIVEQYFASDEVEEAGEVGNPGVITEEVVVDAQIDRYAATISRTLKK